MKRMLTLISCVLMVVATGTAQGTGAGRQGLWFAFAGPASHPQDDPAYAAYRKGYGCIMEEQWGEARKVFEELQRRYPKSQFSVDAAYWSAYALAQMDRRRAIGAYEQFLERFPRSRYFEDATADYAALRAVETPRESMDSVVIHFRLQDEPQIRVIQEHGLRSLELAVRRMNRTLRFGFPAGAIPDPLIEDDGRPDHATQLKLEALSALGEIREDAQAFRTLQEMARDTRQPPLFRSAALRSIAQFSKFDPLPVLVDAARNDTNRAVQQTAIFCMGRIPGDREKSMASLTGLYDHLPKGDDLRRLAVIDAAASLGTNTSVTFLIQVARTAPDPEIQTTAIDNITVAGKNKHRNVELLIDLYRSLPPEQKQARETALYGVAEMGTDRAVDFLVDVARNGNDYDLRKDAVVFLGTIGGTKARNALYDILRAP